MNDKGEIYEIMKQQVESEVERVDEARLEGYLRGRAEAVELEKARADALQRHLEDRD